MNTRKSANVTATRAYLIDPFKREVRAVALHARPGTHDELHEIYALLECDYIEAINPSNAGADVIYLDENGKIKSRAVGTAQQFFGCLLWPHDVLAGKALWIGSLPDGNNTDPECDIGYVRDHIIWRP